MFDYDVHREDAADQARHLIQPARIALFLDPIPRRRTGYKVAANRDVGFSLTAPLVVRLLLRQEPPRPVYAIQPSILARSSTRTFSQSLSANSSSL